MIFDGLQVLELTWGIAGPMVGRLLADQGATVTRIEPPDDPFAGSPGYRVWNRGKRSFAVDLKTEAGRDTFLALADGADVVIDSFRPGVTSRLGIGSASLRARNPGLITCSITAYGSGNEHSDRPGYEALVAARTGNQWAQWGGIMSDGDLDTSEVPIPEGAEQAARPDGPIFSASPWMSLNGFYDASAGIAAALVARQRTGTGRHVEASMLPRPIGSPMRGTWMNVRGAPRGLFQCKDGRWVHHWPVKPQTVLDAAEYGRLEDAPPPEYSHRRIDPARIDPDPENIVVLFHYLPLMRAAFKKFPAEEWRAWGERVKEGVQIVRPPEDALCDPLLLTQGSVVEVDDPELGPIRHLGVVTEFSATRSGRQVGRLGDQPAGQNRGRPLAGVRVVDLGVAVAGPYGASVLAELGADVIKVDAPWDGAWLATGMGRMANQGKRHVTLDLGEPAGLAELYELVETADIVTHNLAGGVAERLGVGYQDLRRVNPSVIYCICRGFDETRSALGIPGTDQAASALAGQEWEDGGCARGGRPFFGTSMGDLGAGFLVAIGAMHALYHRDRTGEGQQVSTAVLNACLVAASGTFAFPDGSGPDRPRLDARQLGLGARYRLYETAEGWLCVAAVTDDHWRRLCGVVGRVDPTADDLEAWFATRSAKEWFDVLDGAGVPVEISLRGYGASP